MQLGHHGRRWSADDLARVRIVCETTTLSSVKIGDLLCQELHRTAASIVTKIAELKLRTMKVKKTRYAPRYPREDQGAIGGDDGRPTDNGDFARAMHQAIADGTEAPPIVGADKTPGTKAPRAIEHSSSLSTKNVLADV